MSKLLGIVELINGVLWDYILIFALCGIGIYFTIRLKFIQVRKFKESFKSTFGQISLSGKKAGAHGMTSFQSLVTSIAAQIGTGNLAGVATAMVAGGAGAVFWMWVSAFLGMAIIYVEAILAQKFKVTKDGEVLGGPVYYIMAAFKGKIGKFIAGFFSVAIIIALGLVGNMIQSNSIGLAMENAFNIPTYVTGIVLGLIALLVFGGGVTRIAAVAEKIVPIMAIFFTVSALIVIGVNFKQIPSSFVSIFAGAFSTRAIVGGAIGVTVKQAIRFGISRGLFTHEAGMGSTPHAHAVANVKNPCDQGLVAMMGVFIDTFVLLPLTVFAILTTGVMGLNKGIHIDDIDNITNGIELTQAAYASVFGETWGYGIIAICVLFFAFATIIGWYYFGLSNVKYLFGKRFVPIYAMAVAAFIGMGCTLKVELVWELGDLFNGIMVVPNLLALTVLSNLAIKMTKDYELGK
ncbi:MAG: sodium:alanine symporter family protein [Clostridiales bacterium]|nr:sodium:alanine symporter family protein [Clostridiales bacterium]